MTIDRFYRLNDHIGDTMKTIVLLPSTCIGKASMFLMNHWAIETVMGYPKGLESLWNSLDEIKRRATDDNYSVAVTFDSEATFSEGLYSICSEHWNLLRLAVEPYIDENTMGIMCDFEPKSKPYRMESYRFCLAKRIESQTASLKAGTEDAAGAPTRDASVTPSEGPKAAEPTIR